MIIVSILSWIVFGLVVGLCARLLVPGRQVTSLAGTTLLGIGGSIVGGLVASTISGQPLGAAHPAGFLGSLIGAVLCLCLVVALDRPARA